MLTDKLKAVGSVTLALYDSDGNLKEKQEINNMVVTTGLNLIATLLANKTGTAMTHMAVGTNNTAASLGQTALLTEIARVALTSATASGSSVSYVATFGAGSGTGALVEAGLFNDPTVGTMLARTVFSVVNKGASDTITVTWTITVS